MVLICQAQFQGRPFVRIGIWNGLFQCNISVLLSVTSTQYDSTVSFELGESVSRLISYHSHKARLEGGVDYYSRPPELSDIQRVKISSFLLT